jgi:hypothetical protein
MPIKLDWLPSGVVGAKKKPRKKSAKKKVVKEKVIKPPPPPVRESPFKLHDVVWRPKGNYPGVEWIKGKILKCQRPTKEDKRWNYTFEDGNDFEESQLFPLSIFHMIATDAVKLRKAPFETELNNVFDGTANIFAVYRTGQKRPWAYYVFPKGYLNTLCKQAEWTNPVYGGAERGYVHLVPAEKLELKLLPISSHPREILTYLGLHVYSRLWMKQVNNGNQENS